MKATDNLKQATKVKAAPIKLSAQKASKQNYLLRSPNSLVTLR